MTSTDISIRNIGIVPVIKIDSPKQALPLGKALLDGMLPVAEITFRTEAGKEGIKIMSEAYPELLVGAGTITSPEMAKIAIQAGARFIVSPGFDPDIIRYCQQAGIPVYPGTSDATQVQQAVSMGLEVVKFFPAEASGGIPMLDALSAPFPNMSFMPTGGIGIANLSSYIKKPYIIACGGSWMVKPELFAQERWDEVSRLCREAVNAVHGFSFAHVGISEESIASCRDTATLFSTLLQPMNEGNSSIFVSDFIEITKSRSRGAKGHIGIKTWNIERALQYLSRFGFTVVQETLKRDAKGTLTVAYLDKEFGGFAVHLIKAT